jgi:hypothetical protein
VTLQAGDTVRRVYRTKYGTGEGLRLGVVEKRVSPMVVSVKWEDGGLSTGEDACYRKVSEEEAAAVRLVPLEERMFKGELT